MTWLLIALGAGVGAPARSLTDRTLQRRHPSLFLGVVAGAGRSVSPNIAVLLGTGFCGALSTYSTFSYETLRLVQDGARRYAVANVAVSLVVGIGAAALGWLIGSALT